MVVQHMIHTGGTTRTLCHPTHRMLLQYDCLDDAVVATAQGYADGLRRAAERAGAVLYIHPVPPGPPGGSGPMLAARLNAALRQEFGTSCKRRCSSSTGSSSGSVRWLDFGDALQEAAVSVTDTSDGCSNAQPLSYLDGCHLHPSYLPLLAAALDSSQEEAAQLDAA